MFERAESVHVTIGVLLNLADCYEKLGRLASARSKFDAAEVAAREASDSRESYARERGASLEKRIPRLTVEASSLGRMPGAELRLDGKHLAEGEWATAIAVDPGHHTLDARAPNKKPWVVAFDLEASATVRVPMLDDVSASVGGVREAGGHPTSWDGRHIAALSLLAASAASLGAGVYFGLQSQSKHEELRSNMSSASSCATLAAANRQVCDGFKATQDEGNRDGILSYAFYAGTGLFMVGAAATWLLLPKKVSAHALALRVTPVADGRGATLSLSGSF